MDRKVSGSLELSLCSRIFFTGQNGFNLRLDMSHFTKSWLKFYIIMIIIQIREKLNFVKCFKQLKQLQNYRQIDSNQNCLQIFQKSFMSKRLSIDAIILMQRYPCEGIKHPVVRITVSHSALPYSSAFETAKYKFLPVSISHAVREFYIKYY